jgi:hypothetical protein
MERMAAGVVDKAASVLVVSPLIGDALVSVRELDTPRVAQAPRHRLSRRREPSGLKFDRCLRPGFRHAEHRAGVFAVGPTRVEDRVPDEAAVDRARDRVRPWLAVAPGEVACDPHARQRVSALIDRRGVDHLRHGRTRGGDLRRSDGEQSEDGKGRGYAAAHPQSLTQPELRCLGVEIEKAAVPDHHADRGRRRRDPQRPTAAAIVEGLTPGVGLEPTTSRLTVERICQIELPRIGLPRKGIQLTTTV